MRTFIAVALPPELGRELHRSAVVMQQLVGRALRVPPPENLHLTLKFIGEMAEDRQPELADALRESLAGARSFTASVGGYGAFPAIRRARVFWTGVEDPEEALTPLAAAVEAAAAAVGAPPERRAFAPHITLGRCRQPRALPMRAFLERVDEDVRRSLTVNAVTVFRSDPGPESVIYTPVFRQALTE